MKKKKQKKCTETKEANESNVSLLFDEGVEILTNRSVGLVHQDLKIPNGKWNWLVKRNHNKYLSWKH